ncbi:MAG TPA: hypothetical protein VGF86_15465 [Candidatus Tumulicola sp.]
MDVARDLRKPPYVFAVIVIAIAVLLEMASNWLPQEVNAAVGASQLGISALWLLDISLFWTLFVGALAIIVRRDILGRLQGVATLVLSIVIILVGLKILLTDFILLLIMLALLASFFGWLVYFPLFAHFDTAQAVQVLGLLTLFKLVALALLIVAQQRFLRQTPLLVLIGLSLLCDLLLSFLHALPPGVLVSVTDALGAIVICIVAIVYALIQAIASIVAIIRALLVRGGHS